MRSTALLTLGTALLVLTGASAGTDPLAGDRRLDAPVRISAEGVPVSEVLARIQKITGVPLQAEGAASDDRVVLFGPDRPLREVLADLAALFGDRWRRSPGASGDRYLLYRDPQVARLERELPAAPERTFLAEMERQVRALRETPEQLARRDEKDPIRRYLSDPEARLATQIYAGLSLRQKTALLAQRRLRLLYGMLPPEHQAFLRRVAEEQEAEARRVEQETMRGLRIAISRRRSPPDLNLRVVRATFVKGEYSPNHAFLEMYPGGTFFARFPWDESLPPLHGNPYTGQPIAADAPLPAAEQVVGAKGAGWIERLRELSARARVPVLSDAYRIQVRPYRPAPVVGEGSIAELDRFCAPDGTLWWTRGRTLLFRERDWYLQRLHDIPDRWLDSVTRRLQSQEERATYGDLVRLAELTPRQLQGLMFLGQENRSQPIDLSFWEDRLAGLSELLSIMKGRAVPRSVAELRLLDYNGLKGEEGQRVYEAMTLRFPQMNPVQRERILPFLVVQRQDLDGVDLESFSVNVRAGEPSSHKRPHRYVPVEIEWHMKGGRGDYEDLFLPLTIPDDRRDRTVVERLGAVPADSK
jgi:hypothetical protein